MNKIKIIICFLLLSSGGFNFLNAQEKKNRISLSGSVAQYYGIHDFGKPKTEDSYHFPVSPGAQFIYWRQIFASVDLGIGINYQKVHYQSQLDTDVPGYFGSRKFQFEEFSIPLLLRKNIPANNHNHCYITLGVYNGRQQNIIVKGYGSPGWGERDYTTLGGYSNDQFLTDLYLDAGYALHIGGSGEISLAPFYKYRVNQTWVNTYSRKSIVGINLNYSLKFKP